MQSEELAEFSQTFHEEIRAEAHVLGAMREEIFVKKMGDLLEEYGDIPAMSPCSYRGSGVKVDGYHFDDELKDFTLIVSQYLDETDSRNTKVTNTDINSIFKRAVTFLTRSLKGLHERIDISHEAHDLASLIYTSKEEIRAVKIILITDGLVQKRAAETEEVDNIQIVQTLWDIERTFNFYKTGEREKITIDFADYCSEPLPCVVMNNGSGVYTSYLGFMPGTALADMYAKWGIRLLDMNVRVFLSSRGNVNKGIRETIQKDPQMFCAYNNGITAFAQSVEVIHSDGCVKIVRADDFQIVNGGQTTASLYHTRRKDRAFIDSIRVAMKLTVVHKQEEISVLVPKISEYSNTQNKVQVADLAANQAPHPEIQAISNAILAPDPTGGSQQSYWFYERTRGSYEEMRNLTAKTPAQKRQFDALRPKSQKFDKIKFGKVWNTYLRLPHVVSLGAQKNFGRFNEWLHEQVEGDWVSFFRKTVALIILWNSTEKLVRRQRYDGYHHNIVAYTLAWLFHLTNSQLDLEKIWQKQTVSENIMDVIESMAEIVNEHIRNTPQNVTEYCKKEECWNKLRDRIYSVETVLRTEYIGDGQQKAYNPRLPSEGELIDSCVSKGAEAWFKLSKWLKDRNFLTPKARSQCFNMGKIIAGNRVPTLALSAPCKKAWDDAVIRGWSFNPEGDEE